MLPRLEKNVGDVYNCEALVTIYRSGVTVKKDPQKTFLWATYGAKLGSVFCMKILGDAYSFLNKGI